MAVRSRLENLQRQRKKGGGRKDAEHAFKADAGGRLAGNIIPRLAPEVEERDERVEVGEGVGTTRMERKNRKRWPAAGLVGVRVTKIKGAAQSVSFAARRDINPFTALIRSAACVVVKAIRWRSAPASSLF